MVLLIIAIITFAILFVLIKLYLVFKSKITFFVEGLSLGFSIFDLRALWKVSTICVLDEPTALFYSVPALTECITNVKGQVDEGGKNLFKFQKLLSKLYKYRTKIENDKDSKRSLESTRYLENGQKLRIVFPGKGVYSSEIINNGGEIIISLPTQQGQLLFSGKDWINQTISVYLWRKGDARYVFDTIVTGEGMFARHPCLHLRHSSDLVRTQKRNSIRAKCQIMAQLYIINDKEVNYNQVETKPGYKSIIEDISEKGALIRIGGKGVPNIKIRLQFQLNGRLVVMFGVIRTVEYNEEINQSRLHFECVHIDEAMRNQILSFVYNIIPQKEKEIFDAVSATVQDETDAEVEDVKNVEKNESISDDANLNENDFGIVDDIVDESDEEELKPIEI